MKCDAKVGQGACAKECAGVEIALAAVENRSHVSSVGGRRTPACERETKADSTDSRLRD